MLQKYPEKNLTSMSCLSLAACSEGKDVAFAIDTSGSIASENFQFIIRAVQSIVMRLPLVLGTHIGLITYGDAVSVSNPNFTLYKYIICTKSIILNTRRNKLRSVKYTNGFVSG